MIEHSGRPFRSACSWMNERLFLECTTCFCFQKVVFGLRLISLGFPTCQEHLLSGLSNACEHEQLTTEKMQFLEAWLKFVGPVDSVPMLCLGWKASAWSSTLRRFFFDELHVMGVGTYYHGEHSHKNSCVIFDKCPHVPGPDRGIPPPV